MEKLYGKSVLMNDNIITDQLIPKQFLAVDKKLW